MRDILTKPVSSSFATANNEGSCLNDNLQILNRKEKIINLLYWHMLTPLPRVKACIKHQLSDARQHHPNTDWTQTIGLAFVIKQVNQP